MKVISISTAISVSRATMTKSALALLLLLAGCVTAEEPPCDCPYDTASDGKQCGARSAYCVPGGRTPQCDEKSPDELAELCSKP